MGWDMRGVLARFLAVQPFAQNLFDGKVAVLSEVISPPAGIYQAVGSNPAGKTQDSLAGLVGLFQS